MAGKRKRKIKDKKRIMLLLSVVVFLIIVLVATVFRDWSQIMANKKQTTELHNKYNLLLEEEESLNSEVTKLQDPTYVARYAREKYLYSKDGETILRIVDGKKIENNKNDESKQQAEKN